MKKKLQKQNFANFLKFFNSPNPLLLICNDPSQWRQFHDDKKIRGLLVELLESRSEIILQLFLACEKLNENDWDFWLRHVRQQLQHLFQQRAMNIITQQRFIPLSVKDLNIPMSVLNVIEEISQTAIQPFSVEESNIFLEEFRSILVDRPSRRSSTISNFSSRRSSLNDRPEIKNPFNIYGNFYFEKNSATEANWNSRKKSQTIPNWVSNTVSDVNNVNFDNKSLPDDGPVAEINLPNSNKKKRGFNPIDIALSPFRLVTGIISGGIGLLAGGKHKQEKLEKSLNIPGIDTKEFYTLESKNLLLKKIILHLNGKIQV